LFYIYFQEKDWDEKRVQFFMINDYSKDAFTRPLGERKSVICNTRAFGSLAFNVV